MSNSELMLYLCNKYDLPQQLKDKFQIYFDECSLKLAFHSRNKKLADEVRRKKTTFTVEEWLLYSGAKNSIFYHVFRLAVLFRNAFRKSIYNGGNTGHDLGILKFINAYGTIIKEDVMYRLRPTRR
jgi:hypothetical protein